MPATHLLALDQGTTSSRAIVFDLHGRLVATAQREFAQHFPKPGWVEHDAAEIWQTQLAVAKAALKKAKLKPADVAAIGITNQRETVVLWDRKTGEPVAPAIVWQDRRTAGFCDGLKKEGHETTVRRTTGLVIDAYFSASKIRWLLDHHKGLRRRVERGEIAFGTIDCWLLWKLTSGRVHATDVSNAARTSLMDLSKGRWDPKMLDLFGVPASLLPEIRSSSEVFGTTTLLGGEIPIAGIAGDQQAALFGQRCVKPGMVKNTYGTGCFMVLHTGQRRISSKNKLLTTAAWKLGDGPIEYALEGSIFIAGAVVQWLRDGLGIIKNSAEVEALAAQVTDTGGVFLVPAFAGLGAPHWDPYARGTLVGMTRGTSRAHIARAALEGIALEVADILEAMRKDSGIDIRELRVDGGASNNGLLMQMQSDLLGVPVQRPVVTETTALGAALLAGLGVGVWKSASALDQVWKPEARFKPRWREAQRTARRAEWRRALERAKGWATE
ncbi:MAG: glycerol kinase GlpK [Verrucomicrobiales bacterium]|nr:glycerol kinase GlpK [Verrucomicrobiales bacterium]